jgi:hypothetical protein
MALPLSINAKVKALVVLSLHEPLLSVAGLCKQGLNVMFTKAGCNILKAGEEASSALIGCGYCCGNLYYLPAEPVSSFSTSTSLSIPFDNSLMSWNIQLSHVGLRPLKHLLRTNNITPSVANEINVQQCPVCVQCKMS